VPILPIEVDDSVLTQRTERRVQRKSDRIASKLRLAVKFESQARFINDPIRSSPSFFGGLMYGEVHLTRRKTPLPPPRALYEARQQPLFKKKQATVA
jgi:hypothetical protein